MNPALDPQVRFPRASRYHPDWVLASASGGANALWLAEWLAEAIELRAGMRVLDLGCGRAMSSVFLHREFGAQVWAVDLWHSASENLERIRDAGVDHGVFPIHADARSLPFAAGFFDAVVSLDAFVYFGTDDLYLIDLARFVRPGGAIGIAGAGLTSEFDVSVPDHLREWWEPGHWCLHSADWWRRHWQRTGVLDVELADTLPDGWRLWLQWQRTGSPNNTPEIAALEADAGRHLAYVRVVGRRTEQRIDEPIVSIPPRYVSRPLLRGPAADPTIVVHQPVQLCKPKLETSIHMELILAILAAGPTGFFVRRYEHGLAAYLAAWAIVLPIQTVVVYSQDDGGWLYWVFNALILAGGIGINRLGSAAGRRKRTRNIAAVDPVRS